MWKRRPVSYTHLGEAFIREAEMLREENERAYRHMYLGEAVGGEAQVFDNLCLREVSDAEIAAMDTFVCGLDFGFVNDPDAFVRMHFDPARKRLVLTGEFVRARLSAEALAGEAVSYTHLAAYQPSSSVRKDAMASMVLVRSGTMTDMPRTVWN